MRLAISAVSAVLVLALVSCSSVRPLPIRAGETCYGCRQLITDIKLGAEMIDAQGHAFKFRTAGCLAKYLRDHPDEKLAGTWVTDYNSGRFVAAKDATYVRAIIDEASRERNYYAFRSASDAAAFAREKASTTADWLAVREQVRGN